MQLFQDILLLILLALGLFNMILMTATLIQDYKRTKQLNNDFEKVIKRLSEDCQNLSENTTKQ